MGRRKSKETSGHSVVSHHELRHKLTGDHGTLQRRLAGHAQYQLGDCGLSLTPLVDAAAVLCSPSGHLYEDQAILEYLVTQTQLLKEQQEKALEAQKEAPDAEEEALKKRKAAFDASQKQWTKKQKPTTDATADKAIQAAKQDLKRTSYWLADSQPILKDTTVEAPTSLRPQSPHSGEPLRRKDLWPLKLQFSDKASSGGSKQQIVCSLTGKPIRSNAAIAYWTSKDEPGRVVLEQDGYQQLIVGKSKSAKNSKDSSPKKPKLYCPETNQKIKFTRNLQRSGSSFATSGQATVVSIHRPSMT